VEKWKWKGKENLEEFIVGCLRTSKAIYIFRDNFKTF
jgi:hypothetical protein